ncbi:MAG: hypothetical protein HOV87_33160 [Catenulispora sp.]|nr:hypothetical protein [Catenulispora sp.]
MASQRWRLQGSASGEHAYFYSGEEARLLLGNRLGHGSQETWFEDDQGRLLGVITNGERAMVVLLDGAGEAGEHLVDPGGQGRSDGFLLANGQVDAYDDRDTVVFGVAGRAVAQLIDHGGWPDDVVVGGGC